MNILILIFFIAIAVVIFCVVKKIEPIYSEDLPQYKWLMRGTTSRKLYTYEMIQKNNVKDKNLQFATELTVIEWVLWKTKLLR